jgi:hypothetical protein
VGDDPEETPAAAAFMTLPLPDGGTQPLGGDVELGARDVIQMEISGLATCVLLKSRHIRCWGAGGHLGYSHQYSVGDELTPAQAATRYITNPRGEVIHQGGDLDLGGSAAAMASGGRCALLVTPPRTLVCWGDNSEGQLGLGITMEQMPDMATYSPMELRPIPYE